MRSGSSVTPGARAGAVCVRAGDECTNARGGLVRKFVGRRGPLYRTSLPRRAGGGCWLKAAEVPFRRHSGPEVRNSGSTNPKGGRLGPGRAGGLLDRARWGGAGLGLHDDHQQRSIIQPGGRGLPWRWVHGR